jgi:hypothetical protein
MISALRSLTIVSAVLVFTATNALAQKVPVRMEAPTTVNADPMALRYSTSLSDEIQLSGKFYLWTGTDSSLPANGIRILLRSLPVRITGGRVIGSVIFVEADHCSAKDPGYYKVVSEQMWMIPTDDSVAEETRGFLASVSRVLDGPSSR